jgi:[ribosomal protein S18]-alanine N-acetyltransferase
LAKTTRSTKVRIVPLAEAHIPEILEIEKRANSAPWSERSFRGELTNPQSIFLTALEENRVAGFAGVWMVVDEAHVTTVAVHEDFRRQGIGRALTAELLKLAKERGAVCATLEVRASNEHAIALYESLGFYHAARRRGYYPDNREDAIVMWKDALK